MNRRWLRLAPLLLLGVAAAALAQDPSALPPVDLPVDAVADAAAAGGDLFKWAVLGLGVVSLGVLAAVGRRYAAMIALFAGLAAIFAGERLFGAGSMHWPLTAVGVVAVVGSFGLRARALAAETDDSRRSAQRTGLLTGSAVLVGLALYALGTDGVTASLGYVDEEE